MSDPTGEPKIGGWQEHAGSYLDKHWEKDSQCETLVFYFPSESAGDTGGWQNALRVCWHVLKVLKVLKFHQKVLNSHQATWLGESSTSWRNECIQGDLSRPQRVAPSNQCLHSSKASLSASSSWFLTSEFLSEGTTCMRKDGPTEPRLTSGTVWPCVGGVHHYHHQTAEWDMER